MRVAGVVLAGGRSQRMGGGHKFLLEVGHRRLIDHVVARLAPQVQALAISANCEPGLLPAGLEVLPDRPPSRGPLSGLLAGLCWAAGLGDATHVATVAADTPFFPEDLVARLAAARHDGKATLAASQGRAHPTFGLWSVEVLPFLADFLESSQSSSVLAFAGECAARTVEFDVDRGDPFFNVNEPADLEVARQRLVGS
jgi:molybdopterin-guanine dinucleotide biosynthesis protein A